VFTGEYQGAVLVSVESRSTGPDWGHYGPLGFLALGICSWLEAVLTANFSQMGILGLDSIVGWPYFAAILCLASGLVWELVRSRQRTLIMVLLTVSIVLVIFGTAPAIEPIARNPTSWTHVGFVRYIAEHGAVLQGYDARFYWPGMFALAAFLDTVTGQHSPIIFLSWAPVVFELLYLAPLRVIARASGVGHRAGWIGTVLFYSFNWIDQDYFSPQALNMLFFLVVVATIMAFWRPANETSPLSTVRQHLILRLRASVIRWWRSIGKVAGTESPLRQLVICALIVVLIGASAASHQFTPYALVVALAVCYLTRRLPGRELPLISAVFAVSWLSFAAFGFWRGHLSLVFGGVGDVASSVGANVTSRVSGSFSHRMIVDLRLVLGATSLVGAAAGLVIRRSDRLTLGALSFAPFLLLGLGSYGGEALLRCLLFSFPFSTLLFGVFLEQFLKPGRLRNRPRIWSPRFVARINSFGLRLIVLVVVLAAVISLTTLVRGGNDAYESFTTTERDAVTYVYHVSHPGQSVASTTLATEQLPWRDNDIGVLHFEAPSDQGGLPDIATSLLRLRPDWVIATANQERWGELVEGWNVGWQARVVNELLRAGYRVAKSWPDAEVLKRVNPVHLPNT
jgi:hypothetical protein